MQKQKSKINRTVLVYTAAFIDGEGCISTSVCRQNRYPRITIVNSDITPLKMIQDNFGGNIRSIKKPKGHWRQTYSLTISHQKALDLIKKTHNFYIVKKSQADIFIAWDYLRSVSKINDPEYKEAVDLISNQLKWLNKKGSENGLGDSPFDLILKQVSCE